MLVSVLISHLAWAHGGVDMMVGHTNAGASDLDRASIGLLGSTPALEDSLHLGGIDLEWLCRLAKKQEWEGGKDCCGSEEKKSTEEPSTGVRCRHLWLYMIASSPEPPLAHIA